MAGPVENKGSITLRNAREVAAAFGVGVAGGYLAGRALRRGMDGRSARVPQGTTEERTKRYYNEAQSYLTGQLQGTCHFGYTEVGQPFALGTALHGMEVQLGQALGLEPGATVVDAGCGFGRVAKTMASEFGLNVIGVDLVPQRVEEARRFAQEHGVSDRVSFIEGSYSKLPLKDNSVDAIYTMETLCHADSLEDTLAEFRRVLKPGGKLVNVEYTIPPHESLGRIRRKITDTMVNNTGMASIGHFTHGAFPSIMESAGFEGVDVRDISQNVWPTWHHLFKQALQDNRTKLLPKILHGTLMDTPNLAGSLMIWPYRRQLRENIITSTKPNIDSQQGKI
ncbi:MAG TPA: methyltransferase domain-containing protein [Candidatus Acidoferrales bacterium]|nr:methyltransferase domain-containing protein [Candidatus Acidoferrales bacterium]